MLRMLRDGQEAKTTGSSGPDEEVDGGFGLYSTLLPYITAALTIGIVGAALLLTKSETLEPTDLPLTEIYAQLDLVATIVFAIGGAAVAVAHAGSMPFGPRRDLVFMACAFLTANGGGTFRDLMSGAPVFWTQAWIYSVLPLLIGYFASKVSMRCSRSSKAQLIIMDNFSAGVFASSGVLKASLMIAPGDVGFVFLAMFMGTVTAAGGGAIRDIFVLKRIPTAVTTTYGIAAMVGSAFQAQIMTWTLSEDGTVAGMPVWLVGMIVVFLFNELTKGLNPTVHLSRGVSQHATA